MPRGSAPGERRGGRKKGTPNRRTAELLAPVAPNGELTPKAVMLEAMHLWHQQGKHAQAVECAAKVAPYIHPRLSAVDARVSLDLTQLSDAELAALIVESEAALGDEGLPDPYALQKELEEAERENLALSRRVRGLEMALAVVSVPPRLKLTHQRPTRLQGSWKAESPETAASTAEPEKAKPEPPTRGYRTLYCSSGNMISFNGSYIYVRDGKIQVDDATAEQLIARGYKEVF